MTRAERIETREAGRKLDLPRAISWIAATVAVLVAIALPAGYFTVASRSLGQVLFIEADAIARVVTQLINSDPALWSFQEHRLSEMLARYEGSRPELRRLVAGGQLVVEKVSGDRPAPPFITARAPLYDAGVVVGQVEVVGSLLPVLRTTVVVALAGLALGVLLFTSLRVFPARALLAQREQTLRRIVENSPDIIAIVRSSEGDHRISYLSRAVTFLGRDPEILIGRSLYELVHPEDRAAAHTFLAKVTRGRTSAGARLRFLSRDNSPIWMDIRGAPAGGEVAGQGGLMVVAREVTAQVELEEALKRAKDEAERANLAKSEFLSRMSHELRTPLNAILGFAQLMAAHDLPPDEKQESVEQILAAGQHLLQLIEEVLDISRIEVGRIDVTMDRVPLGELFLETAELVESLARERAIRVKVPREGSWQVLGDRHRVKQVLLNLLSNAIKYNKERGMVTVSAIESAPGVVRVSVQDTGPGIAPDKVKHLFIPFERLGAERSGIEGTGLGLALSRSLVEAMGGHMGLESTTEQGSTFWFELTLLASEPSAPTAARVLTSTLKGRL